MHACLSIGEWGLGMVTLGCRVLGGGQLMQLVAYASVLQNLAPSHGMLHAAGGLRICASVLLHGMVCCMQLVASASVLQALAPWHGMLHAAGG